MTPDIFNPFHNSLKFHVARVSRYVFVFSDFTWTSSVAIEERHSFDSVRLFAVWESNLKALEIEVDSLKNVVRGYEKGQSMPNISREILDLIKIPETQSRIEPAVQSSQRGMGIKRFRSVADKNWGCSGARGTGSRRTAWYPSFANPVQWKPCGCRQSLHYHERASNFLII